VFWGTRRRADSQTPLTTVGFCSADFKIQSFAALRFFARPRADADYKSVDAKGPIRNQLASNGLFAPTFVWDRTHLASLGLISSDAGSKPGYNDFCRCVSASNLRFGREASRKGRRGRKKGLRI
jgi:hypothetical protein